MVMKEDQDRCRSLVCDPNGIIVAEMVYRCMICFYVSETTIEAKAHYTMKHLDEEDKDVNDNNKEMFQDDTDENYYNKYANEEALSPDDDFQRYSPLVTMTEGMEDTAVNVNCNVSGGKSGYVKCAVCSVTRYYSCVQRRYGQYTCVTCYRFFRAFLIRPKKYSCPNLGECKLDVRSRCRACWLKTCIDVFSIDMRRQPVVEDYRPVKNSLSNASSAGSNVGSAVSIQSDNNSLIESEEISENVSADNSGELSTITYNSGEELPSILDKSDSPLKKNNNSLQKVKVTAGKKVWSCGKCETCMAEDCGKCIYCLDRPKFGGPFIKKQRCIKRRCLMKTKNKSGSYFRTEAVTRE